MTEAAAVAKIPKAPFEAWPCGCIFLLLQVGGQRLPPMVATCAAARTRYAHTHEFEWRHGLTVIEDSARDNIEARNLCPAPLVSKLGFAGNRLEL